MNNSTLQNIEQELYTLKASVKKWKIATLALLLGGGLFAAGTAGPTVLDHLVVNRIDVLGDTGTPIVSIGEHEHGGRIDLYNPSGVNLLRLSTTSRGGDVAIWDNAGTNVAGIWATPQGGTFSLWNNQGEERSQFSSGALTLSGENASLHIQNEQGNPVAVVASDPQGHGRFQIADTNGAVVSEMKMIPNMGGGMIVNTVTGKQMGVLAATDNGGKLNLMNNQGVPIFIASPTSSQGGALSVLNARGIPVILMTTDGSQSGLFEIFDEDGNGARRIRPLRSYAP